MSKYALALGALSLFASFPAAHEDDPKILDRRPAYRGQGFRAARTADPRSFGMNALSAGTTLSFPANNVQLLSWLPVGEFGSQHNSANDCWGYVSPSGTEYALLGLSHGTAFIDLDNPADPQVVAVLSGPTSMWRDIKVYQDHAYSVSEGGSGIQVFDMSQIDSGIVTLVNTVTSGGGTTATHNVAIDEASGRLYRLGGGSEGMRIFDLTDPANPTFIGSWMDRYIHDAQILTYTSGPFAGKQIAFACSGFNGGFTNTGLDVLDVTDASNVIVLANILYPNPGYSHQCWITDDGNYLYLNDELDEDGVLPTTTFVFDVSDPSNPSNVGTFTNGNTAIGHNLYVKGDLVYEANYRSGLRVFDTSVSQTNPTEVASFDTWPEDDSDNFNGLWSNYPYFPSGIVIGSDIEKGLFVWWVGAPLLSFSAPGGLPTMIDPQGDTLVINVAEQTPGDLVPGSVQIHFDDGLGTTSVALTPMGGGDFQAILPPVPCGQDLVYYFTAESTGGIVWKDPIGGSADVHVAAATLSQTVAFDFDMESAPGWTSGDPGDAATSGFWTLGNPNGSSAQPEDDHSSVGTFCWFTGQASAGSSSGTNDVDGGKTTLLSPVLNLSALVDPVIRYWRWYSNATGASPGQDQMSVELSDDGGLNWSVIEQVGPLGIEVKGGWIFHQVRVTDFFTPTASMQVRFIVADRGAGSIVEGAIDDFSVVENGCADCDSNGLSDDFDILTGLSTDFDANRIPDVCDPMRETANAISLSAGGTVTFALEAGSGRAGHVYWVFGSASGTEPGLDFGPVNLPLNFDAYFNLILTHPSFANVFTDYQGTLDGNGSAVASITIPSGSDPSLAGATLHHAFTSAQFFGSVEYASNAVPVTLAP